MSDEEIAKEAARKISEWEAKTYGKPDYSYPSQRKEIENLAPIILAAIKKAKAQEIGFISQKDGLRISIP